MKEVVLGIDLGGTNTKFGLVDREGNILVESSMPTDVHETIGTFQEALYKRSSVLIERAGAQLVGVGIGAPNANYYKGTIEYPPNLKWKGITPFVDLFTKYYNVPMVLTNDANAAAIGEMMYGGAKGMCDFIVITLGTGLGSGIVCNGQLLYGHDGFAGELGHSLVNVFGRTCGCGRKGCLETYVSATGIKRTVYKLLADYNGESELVDTSFENLTADQITEAAKRGDKVAIAAFEYTGRILGMKLADAVVHSSPEAIFLFGGLTKADEHIFEPTKRYMEEHMLGIFKGKVKLLVSELNDRNAAVLGAAALVWKEKIH